MSKKGLNIELSLDTDILILKLEAIARHTTALAKELEKIDSVKCPDCGGLMDVTELIGDGGVVVESLRECPRCDQNE